MPAAAIPVLGQIGGAIGGTILGRRSAQGATRPSPYERQAQQAQTEASRALADTSQWFRGYGQPKLQQAGNYFSTVAGGGRAATAQMLAPDVQNINDVYGGTARSLSRFLRSGSRDTQMAELERERAGQVASLFRNSRYQANQTLSDLAANALDASVRATAGSGAIAGQQAAQGAQNRFAGADIQRQAGADMGGLLFELLRSYSPGGRATPMPGPWRGGYSFPGGG